MQEKAELRMLLAKRRAVAQALLPHAGALLAVHFPAQVPINAQTIIAAYMPFRTEIDPLPLLRVLLARGGQGCLTRISPSPLWGGVGVGELERTTPTDRNAPGRTAPTPTPPHKGEGLLQRARRLRLEPTIYEKMLWDLMRAKRPDKTHWRRQVPIGGFVYDFGCHGLKLLVEVDGGVHRLPQVQARDRIKEQVALENGYKLIRLQNEDVLKIETAQYFDQFAQPSPSPLWGGVRVGRLDRTTPTDPNAPGRTAPTPTPPHKGEGLSFHLCDIDNPQHFQPNAWGIREPHEDLPIVAPTILLVPLLGFDRRCYRLGYGKGFYDGAIARLRSKGPVTTIGLAFSDQEVPTIPTQHHDQCLDWIITENGAYPRPS